MLLPLSKDKKFPALDMQFLLYLVILSGFFFEFAQSAISVPIQAELSVGDCFCAAKGLFTLVWFGFCS